MICLNGLVTIAFLMQVISEFVEKWALMCFVVTSIKTLDEKRGTPLPGISPDNTVKPKSKKVDKTQKTEKAELTERRPTPLPDIQMCNDESVEMEMPKCSVVIVMGMSYIAVCYHATLCDTPRH